MPTDRHKPSSLKRRSAPHRHNGEGGIMAIVELSTQRFVARQVYPYLRAVGD
jgi:hypothetical protein